MERRLSTKIREHELQFKNDIQKWFVENNCTVQSNTGTDLTSNFLKYIYDVDSFELTSDDFMRRKRVKNTAPYHERCLAKRADGLQCTRRKRDNGTYCGTHLKGTPHGVIDCGNFEPSTTSKIDVWVEDINGINYCIDEKCNVYDPADILHGVENPKIISQWSKTEEDKYKILTCE